VLREQNPRCSVVKCENSPRDYSVPYATKLPEASSLAMAMVAIAAFVALHQPVEVGRGGAAGRQPFHHQRRRVSSVTCSEPTDDWLNGDERDDVEDAQ
jgi:hypothetical protein